MCDPEDLREARRVYQNLLYQACEEYDCAPQEMKEVLIRDFNKWRSDEGLAPPSRD